MLFTRRSAKRGQWKRAGTGSGSWRQHSCKHARDTQGVCTSHAGNVQGRTNSRKVVVRSREETEERLRWATSIRVRVTHSCTVLL